jgi:hypothetical protein
LPDDRWRTSSSRSCCSTWSRRLRRASQRGPAPPGWRAQLAAGFGSGASTV